MNVHNDPSLSLLSALRPISPQGRAPHTQQPTPTDLLSRPSRTGLPPAATATAPEQPTIDGLLEAWGGKSETYDLDGDGGVNMRDLVALLRSLPRRHDALPTEVQPVDTPPVPPGADLASSVPETLPTQLAPQEPETLPTQLASQEPETLPKQLAPQEPETLPTQLADPVEDPDAAGNITVRDLLAAWGTSDAEFDLDGDGTVNMRDLVQLLRDLNTPSAPGTDLASDNPLTISGLLEQWGRTDSRYDLDGSGTVNMRDLVQMLGRLADQGGPSPLGTNLADQAAERATSGGLRPIAASLAGRLRSGGFDEHPPANIHALVGKLDLTAAQQKELIAHLDAEYPAGLGVNMVA